MSDRTETWIAALALTASGLILLAPVLGRAGYTGSAQLAMAAAAGGGLMSFVMAGTTTLRAARSRPRARAAEDER